MKKNFFNHVAVMISLTLLVTICSAQKQSADPNFNSKMKIAEPDSTVSPAPAATYSRDLASLGTKVLKNFSKNFKDADDVRIIKVKDNTHIYCITNGVTNRIRYDKKGNWNYTIRYYQQDLLPKEIRRQVRSNFLDFEIAGVTEVNVGDKTAYLVRIRSIETWKTVKVLDDEMSIIESFQSK